MTSSPQSPEHKQTVWALECFFYFPKKKSKRSPEYRHWGPMRVLHLEPNESRERLEYAISLQLKPSTTFSMPETTTHSSVKSWCQMRFDDGIGFGQSVMELPQVPQRWKLFADPFHRWH